MSEINVTKNRLRKNHVPTLNQAVAKAQVGDTIIIREGTTKLDAGVEGVPINKELYIEGADSNHVPTLKMTNHQYGFVLQQGNLHLKNLKITLTAQAYGVVASPGYKGSVDMQNVTIQHTGKIIPREYCFSVLFFNTDKNPMLSGQITMNNCHLDDAQIACSGVNVNGGYIGKLDGKASVLESTQLNLNSVNLTHTTCYNLNQNSPVVMTNVATGGRLLLVGNYTLNGLELTDKVQKTSNPLGFLGANPTKLMALYGSTRMMVNGKPEPMPLLMTSSFKGAVNRIVVKKITFDKQFLNLAQNPDQVIVPPYWFNFNNTSVDLQNSTIWGTPFGNKNVAVKGSLSLTSVKDKSRWDVKGTSTSNRGGSTSDLFTHLDLSGLDNTQKTNNSGNAIDKLNSMIGLGSVKKELGEIIDTAQMNHDMKVHHMPGATRLNMHMVFEGGPGTGKTTVARLVGRALYEAGVLKTDKFVESEPSDFIAGYEGQSGPKTKKEVESALGGVLFIDEAYGLGHQPGQNDAFKASAIAQLIAMMENHRDDLVVIMAGYTDPMNNLLNNSNAGLKSRIAHVIKFPDYTDKEMALILQLMLKNRHLQWNDSATNNAMVKGLLSLKKMEGRNDGNGRLVRNYVEAIISKKNVRLARFRRSNPNKWSIDMVPVIKAPDAISAVKSLKQKAKNMKG